MAKEINKKVVYEIYGPSWESCGGIRKIEDFLNRHLYKLRPDIIWLSGILDSPWYDHGYDVSNYRVVSSRLGTMRDFDNLVKRAHSLGIKVIIDLVLNHTSRYHRWFYDHPSYYCWAKEPKSGWKNLFDGGSAWHYDGIHDLYYCHLFHSSQMDLNWFPDGEINKQLVYEFRNIVDFWTKEHNVDGFRIDVPQAINKYFTRNELSFDNLLNGDKSVEVINAIFPFKSNSPFLIMECFDPTYGEIIKKYDNTAVDFFMNVLLKQSAREGQKKFMEHLYKSAENPRFMIDLESHDSPRFSCGNFSPHWWMHKMLYNFRDNAVCLYQGQELGLRNPTEQQLSNNDMLRLDVQTAMRYERGEDINLLRDDSRANARVSAKWILAEYHQQENDKNSILNFTKLHIADWRLS